MKCPNNLQRRGAFISIPVWWAATVAIILALRAFEIVAWDWFWVTALLWVPLCWCLFWLGLAFALAVGLGAVLGLVEAARKRSEA